MYWWRITKYDPMNRNTLGHYMKNEWTDYSDIGKKFDGRELTQKEYLRVENSYVSAVSLFIKHMKISSLEINGLEKKRYNHDELSTPVLLNLYNQIKNYQSVSSNEITDLVRLVLRSDIWCRLESEDLKVHFGWDYYMYIGCTKSCPEVRDRIAKLGLFVEEFISPYIPDREEPEYH